MIVPLRTKWLWVRILLLPLKLHISRLFQARSSLIFRQECRFTLKRACDMIITYNQTSSFYFSIYFRSPSQAVSVCFVGKLLAGMMPPIFYVNSKTAVYSWYIYMIKKNHFKQKLLLWSQLPFRSGLKTWPVTSQGQRHPRKLLN